MSSKVSLDSSSLDRDGYIVIANVLSPDEIAAMNSAIDELYAKAKEDPLFRTGGTLHLDGLKEMGAPFDRAWTNEGVVDAVTHLLGSDYLMPRAHLRAPLAGEGAQSLHADYHMMPLDGGHYVATMIVAIDAFTPDNGATRVVPGSHKQLKLNAPKDHDSPHPEQRIIEMGAGSALVFSGHLWHSGTRNRSGAPRRALQIIFTRPDVRQFS
jgi:ectoine hydroxylase-related dioxygenase (phytanoyl-CoA dioxygenase family)